MIVLSQHDLVSGSEVESVDDEIVALRCVPREHDFVLVGTKVGGNMLPGGLPQRCELSAVLERRISIHRGSKLGKDGAARRGCGRQVGGVHRHTSAKVKRRENILPIIV
jgi:hypothetical protein